jgi:hypothetical protein
MSIFVPLTENYGRMERRLCNKNKSEVLATNIINNVENQEDFYYRY